MINLSHIGDTIKVLLKYYYYLNSFIQSKATTLVNSQSLFRYIHSCIMPDFYKYVACEIVELEDGRYDLSFVVKVEHLVTKAIQIFRMTGAEFMKDFSKSGTPNFCRGISYS